MQLLTRRFVLRDFRESDRSAFLAYQSDLRALAPGGREPTGEQAEHLFDTFRAWAAERPRLNVQLAIARRQPRGGVIGSCGLRRAGCAPGAAVFGLELAPAYWGRHAYALEVARGMLDYGFGTLRLEAITGSSARADSRVARLAAWFGAEAVASSQGQDWRVTRARWTEALGRPRGRP